MKKLIALLACVAISLTGCAKIESSFYTNALAVAEYPERVPYPTADVNDNELYRKQYDAWRNSNSEIRRLETDKTGNADYVKKLVSAVIEDDGENKVMSPANIYFALAMLCECTDGNTRAQILDLLGKSDIESIRKNTPLLWQKMYKNDGVDKSVLANSLWLNDDHAKDYNQNTFDTLKNKYFASAYSGDFNDEQYKQQIRDWINEQTGGLLKEQSQKLEFNPETVLALVSTLYFKAPWDFEFIKENNKELTFHAVNGDVKTEFMNGGGTGTVYYSDKFLSASKTFKDGSMHFILPNEEYTVSDLLKDQKALDLIAGNYDSVESKDAMVLLTIPKFDISFDTDIIEPLQKLGVTDAFEVGTANFNPVGNIVDMYVNSAKHAARVKVDEEGVEGAAYTVIVAEGGSMSPPDIVDFVADRPFIFVVTGVDNLPLFVGVVNNI